MSAIPISHLTTAIHTEHPILDEIDQQHYTLVRADQITVAHDLLPAWESLRQAYKQLPQDEFLPGGGKYRYRRFGRFFYLPSTGELLALPHVDYFQSLEHNQVTGGIIRKFAPLTPELFANPFMHELIRFNMQHFPISAEMSVHPWQVDAHLIRVIAESGMTGEPTPEGIHRDGAEFVTVHLAELENADGGEVTIYDDDKNPLRRLKLCEILDSYLFRDTHVLHGVMPIRPADNVNRAVRSILTFDYHYMPELERPENW